MTTTTDTRQSGRDRHCGDGERDDHSDGWYQKTARMKGKSRASGRRSGGGSGGGGGGGGGGGQNGFQTLGLSDEIYKGVLRMGFRVSW